MIQVNIKLQMPWLNEAKNDIIRRSASLLIYNGPKTIKNANDREKIQPAVAVNIPILTFCIFLHKKHPKVMPMMYGLILIHGWSYKIFNSANAFSLIVVFELRDKFLTGGKLNWKFSTNLSKLALSIRIIAVVKNELMKNEVNIVMAKWGWVRANIRRRIAMMKRYSSTERYHDQIIHWRKRRYSVISIGFLIDL